MGFLQVATSSQLTQDFRSLKPECEKDFRFRLQHDQYLLDITTTTLAEALDFEPMSNLEQSYQRDSFPIVNLTIGIIFDLYTQALNTGSV